MRRRDRDDGGAGQRESTAKISLAPDAAEDAAKELAFAEEGVVKFTEGKDVKKVIYVPGKILNIVAK